MLGIVQKMHGVDLVTRFLDKAERDGTTISDDQLCDVVFNFLLAGRDTTASSLTWCIYELTKNPHLEEIILSEVEVWACSSNVELFLWRVSCCPTTACVPAFCYLLG